MKIINVDNKILWMLVSLLLCMTLFLTARVATADRTFQESVAVSQAKLHYQGRLLDPSTGAPKADGTYTMLFGAYTTPTGGSPLWTETKDVTVARGIFSTLLGDTASFPASLFNGQDLWLGISVGADPQMSPRQPLAYVPYAFYAANAKLLDGNNAGAFASAGHIHSGLPQAYGYVSQYDPLLRSGSYRVDSVLWNSTYSRYEISLTNSYFSIDDIAVATLLGDSGSCPTGATIRTSSVSGKLLVYIVNSAGTKIPCSFHFVAYAGQ